MLTFSKNLVVDWFYLSFWGVGGVCYLQTLKMNGLKHKLIFKEGNKYWKHICLCNTVQFIDSLSPVISFANSTVKFRDLQPTRKTSLEIAFL